MRVLLAILIFAIAPLAFAQDHQATLKPHLSDEVVAVAYLDLAKIDTLGTLEWVSQLGFGPSDEQRGQATKLMLTMQRRLDEAAGYGARYVYVLFRPNDVSHGGPTWILPVDEQGDPRAVLGMLLSGRPDKFEIEHDVRPLFFPDHCEVVGNAVVGANTVAQLAEAKKNAVSSLREMSEMWNAMGDGHGGLLIFGSDDSRRVVRELFPQLPPPFQSVDGPLLADDLQWGGFMVDLPPKPSLEILVQAEDNEAAQTVSEAVNMALTMGTQLPQAKLLFDGETLRLLDTSLRPQLDDSRVTISFEPLFNDLERLAKAVAPHVKQARVAAQRTERIDRFRRIVLGILNYESANGALPPVGTYAEDGSPLLSWRVHILPYLGEEEQALYRKFRLDEPWDSPHNKQLLPLMPDVYADPAPDLTLHDRNAVGRTTFVVPTGPGTAFNSPTETRLIDVKDGLSRTLALVELAPMAAPYWTRPKDWVIDPAMPWERLNRTDRDWITIAFLGGSVHTIPLSTDAKTLRAMTTIDGGELFELP